MNNQVESIHTFRGKSVMKINLFLISFIFIVSVASAELNGPQIIQKVNDTMNQETSRSTSLMTITTSSGDKRTFETVTYTKDKGKMSLIRYLSPSRVKGQAMLLLNNADDIWAYFPRTRRVRKLATHAKRQKMEGSDFSYEDMGSGDNFVKDFITILLGEEKKGKKLCYKLEMVRSKNSDSAYSRMVMWVIKENFVPIIVHYHHDKDPERLTKILTLKDIQNIDGVPAPMSMVMRNVEDGSETILVNTEVRYNIELPDDMFTERGLSE